jgi:beta-lactamase class D
MKHFVGLLLVLFVSSAEAEWTESSAIGSLFKDAEVTGTFVLYKINDDIHFGHNKSRAEKRFIPASTFKIPNSIIGLAAQAVKDVDDILPYKGKGKPFIKEWGRDMGLREAIAMSNVPIYKELARRVGIDRMRENVIRLNYGNRKIGSVVDEFWLKGPLKISALEQTEFLAKLVEGKLDYPGHILESVREIVFLEERNGSKLFGKTGWQNAPDRGVGWWVGWIEKENQSYPFALNIDVVNPEDATKRVTLGKSCLQALGLL